MRHIVFFFLFSGSLFLVNKSNAQPDWKWAVGSRHSGPSYAGFDAQQTAIDQSGNIIVAGYGWGYMMVCGPDTIFNSTASKPTVIIKTDSTGNVLWVKRTLHSDGDVTGIVTDPAGNIYLAGIYDSATCVIDTITLSNPGSGYFSYIAKLSPSGNVIWARNVADGGYIYSSLGIDGAGNLYTSGNFQHTITIGTTTLTNAAATNNDVYIAKLDPAGNFIWAKSFGGTSEDEVSALSVSGNGSVSVAGQFISASMSVGGHTVSNSVAPGFSCFLVRYDSSGNCTWAKEIPHVYGQQMISDDAGPVYLTGYIDTNAIVGTDTLTTHGQRDIVLAKFSASGNPVWARSAGGSTWDMGYGIDKDMCGNLFICGQMGSNPATGYILHFNTHLLYQVPGGNEPMFVAQYDTSGNYITSLGLKSGGDDINRVVVDNKGNFFIGGDYVVAMTLGSYVLPISGGGEALFIAKYKYDSLACMPYGGITTEITNISEKLPLVTLYPNPATYECMVSSDMPFPINSRAELYDLTGRLVNSYSLTGSGTVISVAGLTPGMYQCSVIIGGNNMIVRKLVVMK
jgi:hypothetical protein